MNWSQACSDLQQRGEAYVLVTVIGVRGSTPRNSGTKMVVTAKQLFGTIGGGNVVRELILAIINPVYAGIKTG